MQIAIFERWGKEEEAFQAFEDGVLPFSISLQAKTDRDFRLPPPGQRPGHLEKCSSKNEGAEKMGGSEIENRKDIQEVEKEAEKSVSKKSSHEK